MGALLILPLAAALAFIVRRRIEETVLPAAALMILLLFLSGLAGTFTPGFFLCIALCVLALPAVLILLYVGFRRTGRRDVSFLPFLLTPGLCAYLGFFVIFLLFNRTRCYEHATDFFHWGIAARDYLAHNSYSNIAAATDLFPATPPGTTLWILFSLRLKGVYEESAAFLAQEMLQVAVVLPLFNVIRSRADIRRFFILFFVLLALPMAVSGRYAYATLSPVFLQGLAAAMLLRTIRALMRRFTPGDAIYAASLSVVLSLAGYGGLFIAGILCLLTVIACALDIRRTGFSLRLHLIPCLLLLVPPLVTRIPYRIYLSATGTQNNMQAAAMLRDVAAPLDGVKDPFKILFLFLNGLSDQSISGTIGHALPLSFVSVIALIIVLIFACRVLKGRFPALPVFPMRYLLFTGAGVTLYLAGLYVMYQFLIPAARADELACLDLALIPVTVFVFLRLIARAVAFSVSERRARDTVFFVLLWCGLLSVNLGTLFLRAVEQPEPAEDYALEFAYAQGFQFSAGDKIFYMDRPDTVLYGPYRSYMEESETRIGALYYRLTDEVPVYINLSRQDLRHWEGNTRTDDTLHDVNDLLRRDRYGYVYLESRGLNFTHHYAALFPDTTSLENGKLFAVTTFEDGVVQLQTIARKEDMADWVR